MRTAIKQVQTEAVKAEKHYSQITKDSKTAMDTHKKETDVTAKLEKSEVTDACVGHMCSARRRGGESRRRRGVSIGRSLAEQRAARKKRVWAKRT